MHYEFLLDKIKNNKTGEKITVIICDDTDAPENLVSCAIVGTLQRLELIDVYVCNYTAQTNDKFEKMTITRHNEQDHTNLITQSVISFNKLYNR